METILFYTILFICLTIACRFRKQIWYFSDFCYQKINLYLSPFFFYPIIFFGLYKILLYYDIKKNLEGIEASFVLILLFCATTSIMKLLNDMVKYVPDKNNFVKIIQKNIITLVSLSVNFTVQYNIIFDYNNTYFENVQINNWWSNFEDFFFYSFSIMTNSSISNIRPTSFYTKALSCVEASASFIVIVLILANYQVIGENLRKYFKGD